MIRLQGGEMETKGNPNINDLYELLTELYGISLAIKKLSAIRYKRNLGALSSTYLDVNNKSFVDPSEHERFISNITKNIPNIIAINNINDSIEQYEYKYIMDVVIDNIDKILVVMESKGPISRKLDIIHNIINESIGDSIRTIDLLKVLYWAGIIDSKIVKQLPFDIIVKIFSECRELRDRFEKLMNKKCDSI